MNSIDFVLKLNPIEYLGHGHPPKVSGVQKYHFLGKVSEEIYDEERTIQRRADHGSVEAGGGRRAGF